MNRFMPLTLLAVACLLLSAPISLCAARWTIGTASSGVNVFPYETPGADQLGREITVSAAKGESESAQIVVTAGGEPLSVSRVEVSDLVGASRISKRNIAVERVGYVDIKTSTWRGTKRLGLTPDPLLPFEAFTCPAGENRCLWVTVATPPNSKPGSYKGRVSLFSGKDKLADIPINLHVWNFALPRIPSLATSYWNSFTDCYDPAKELPIIDNGLRLFGKYRTSTNIWQGTPAMWYREKDGRVTCDISAMKRAVTIADAAGYSSLQIGSGCWASASFDAPITDRRTGKPLSAEDRSKALQTLGPGSADLLLGKLYLNAICDWLQARRLLDRAYIQLYDESSERETWIAGITPLYAGYRKAEPRIKLLGLTGIHPIMQGVYDIWSPCLAFYDAATYDTVRNGVSLWGTKSITASVTASSTGGWANPAFYKYAPSDAYDGCDYTKWTPGSAPTQDTPQWLRFDFEKPESLDGMRLLPYGGPSAEVGMVVECSKDGQNFAPLKLSPKGAGNDYSFEPGEYKAIRLLYSKLEKPFTPTDIQPLPAPEVGTAGVAEVEFIGEGLPRESSVTRAKVRPSVMWEYQVGADYPSVCIDADPAEIRATMWQCWQRGVAGYLNYGGAIWQGEVTRPKDTNPLVWNLPGNGSPNITYPGKDGVLPSIRFARFRDGLDDYDYLTLLQRKHPDSPVLRNVLNGGRAIYKETATISRTRAEVAGELQK